MSKSYLYLAGGIILLLVIAGGYLLLSKSNNTAPSSYNPSGTQTANPTSAPITTENADESLSNTDANLQTQLDQADQDLNAAQQSSIGTTSQEDLNSINNL